MTARQIDKLICEWSMSAGHSFTEEHLDSLVDHLVEGLKPKKVPSGMKCPKCGSSAFPWRPCCGYKLEKPQGSGEGDANG